MLKDLLLFLLMMAGGAYGLWIMRGVDGFMKRRREEKGGTAGVSSELCGEGAEDEPKL